MSLVPCFVGVPYIFQPSDPLVDAEGSFDVFQVKFGTGCSDQLDGQLLDSSKDLK